MKASELFERYRSAFGTVPPAAQAYVCHYCLGPQDPNFAQCAGCHRLFHRVHQLSEHHWESVPGELRNSIVPMTAALNPSPWYAYLLQYKRGYLDAYGPIMAVLAHTYLGQHEAQVAGLLGGEPTCVTVVPSKRGFGYAEQPLVRALSRAPSLARQLTQTLEFIPGASVGRHQYNPAAFRRAGAALKTRRVLLLEDAWVTGATATSTAGALLREGAAAVAILSLARVVDAGYWSDANHPYRKAMAAPYDPDNWPRQDKQPD